MTSELARALYCDAPGCINITFWRCNHGFEARHAARQYEHWTMANGKDYCPEHAKLAINPTEANREQ